MNSAISKRTYAQYLKVYQFLKQRTPPLHQDDHHAIVQTFLAMRAQWSKPTERTAKSALCYFLDEAVINGDGDLSAYEAKRELLGRTNPGRDQLAYFCSKEEQEEAIAKNAEVERERLENLNTSQRRLACIRAGELCTLLFALSASQSPMRDEVALWLKAALLTGLDPQEWSTASFKVARGSAVLQFSSNQSSSAARPSSPLRLDKLTPGQLSVIHSHVQNASARAASGQFDAWSRACRAMLLTIVSSIWPNRGQWTLSPPRFVLAKRPENRLALEEASLL